MPLLAFATGPREHTVYLEQGFQERWPDLLAALGPHRASPVCLYLPRSTGADRNVLRALLERSLAETRSRQGWVDATRVARSRRRERSGSSGH